MSNAIQVSDELLSDLARVAVPTATWALGRLGFDHTYAIGVDPLAFRGPERLVGRARTLRFIQLREDLVQAQCGSLEDSPHRAALEAIEPGEVMVIDARGCLEAAVVGDIFTRRVMSRGGRGIVIDGVCRDISAIRQVGLPLFARGVHGQGINRRLMSVGSQQPVQIAGVAVMPGDIILGDGDGIVVIPPQALAEVVKVGLEHEELESWIRERIGAGASLHTHYPPKPEVLDEFEAWMRAQGKQPPPRPDSSRP